MSEVKLSEQYWRSKEHEINRETQLEVAARLLRFSEEQFTSVGRQDLGRGKAAEVWRGSVEDFEDEVCIKTNYNPAASARSLKEEFDLHEQFVAAGVRTPKAILYARGDEELSIVQQGILAMEAIDGPNLEEHLLTLLEKGEKISIERYHELVRDIKAQIETAHKAKLYHRDLHPRNIVLGKKGEAYLIDFGDAAQALGTENEDEIYSADVVTEGRVTKTVFPRDEQILSQIAQLIKKYNLIDKRSKPVTA